MVHGAVLMKIPASLALQPGVQIVLDSKCQQFKLHLIKLLMIEDLCILGCRNHFDTCSGS